MHVRVAFESYSNWVHARRKGGSGLVAFLDLDPAQCELTPPGFVSLSLIADRDRYGSGSGSRYDSDSGGCNDEAPEYRDDATRDPLAEILPGPLRSLAPFLPRGPLLGPPHTHLSSAHRLLHSCFIGGANVEANPAHYLQVCVATLQWVIPL